MDQAEAFKKEGNEFYDAGDFKKALSKYARAFMFLQAVEKQNQLPEQMSEAMMEEQKVGSSYSGKIETDQRDS